MNKLLFVACVLAFPVHAQVRPTQIGPVEFAYPDTKTAWFSQIKVPGFGWVQMPNDAEREAVTKDLDAEEKSSLVYRNRLPTLSSFYGDPYGNTVSYYANVPVAPPDPPATRGWVGIIDGPGRSATEGEMMNWISWNQQQINELRERLVCNRHCTDVFGSINASCGVFGRAAGAAGPGITLACSAGAYGSLQYCMSQC